MQLKDLRAFVALYPELADETEVRLLHQPNYPLQCGLDGEVVIVGCDEERIEELEKFLEGDDGTDEERVSAITERDQLRRDGNQTSVIYLAEGSSLGNDVSPYGDTIACNRFGWR